MAISPEHLHRQSKRETRDLALKQTIETTWVKHPSYGSIKLDWELKVNHKRIARVMKKYGLKPPRRRVRRFCTHSTSHHHYTNLIAGVVAVKPHHIWVGDVTFLWFQDRWWYLATIEDLYTRQVLGAQVSLHHDRFLIHAVVKQAVIEAGCFPDIFHSDQGTEFMAALSTQFWEEYLVQVSVSDKGSPWQNGFKESFYSHFKAEFGYPERFDTIGEFVAAIYEQVHYYNYDRLHRSLKMTPVAYANSVSENFRHIMGT